MVQPDDEPTPSPSGDTPAVSQERRNDINRAMRLLLSKMRVRGHVLSCFLDEPAPERVTMHAPDDGAIGDLLVNSSFRYAPKGDPPAEIRQRLLFTDGLLRGVPLAWIEDPGTGLWSPRWARDRFVEILASLRPGAPAPPTLSPSERQALVRASVLVHPEQEHRRRAMWERICVEAGAQMRSQRHAIVRGLIDPFFAYAMQRYYRALVEEGRLPKGDDTVEERYYLHSEPVAMFLHPQLADIVGRIAGEPVKPSFLYFGAYPSGASLRRHVDRLQCEFSISLLVDYAPDPGAGPCGWPLYLEHPSLPEGVVAADLGIGDAVFYRGREVMHYRHPLREGHQSASIFLNFVRPDFAGDLL